MKRSPVKIGEGGRIVIPAEFRKEMGLDIGDELVLHLENGRMLLFTRLQAIQYVQEQMEKYNTEDKLLSEELLLDRRDEVSNE